MFDNNCIELTNNKIIVIKENKRSLVVNNPEQKSIRKIKFDGCVIANICNQKSCDYGLWVEAKSYFVELKGKHIEHALEQILDTINFCEFNHTDELKNITKKYAVIISSKNTVPKLVANPKYIQLSRKIGKDNIYIKNELLEIQI